MGYWENITDVRADELEEGDQVVLTFMGGSEICDVDEIRHFRNGEVGLVFSSSIIAPIKRVENPDQIIRRYRES